MVGDPLATKVGEAIGEVVEQEITMGVNVLSVNECDLDFSAELLALSPGISANVVQCGGASRTTKLTARDSFCICAVDVEFNFNPLKVVVLNERADGNSSLADTIKFAQAVCRLIGVHGTTILEGHVEDAANDEAKTSNEILVRISGARAISEHMQFVALGGEVTNGDDNLFARKRKGVDEVCLLVDVIDNAELSAEEHGGEMSGQAGVTVRGLDRFLTSTPGEVTEPSRNVTLSGFRRAPMVGLVDRGEEFKGVRTGVLRAEEKKGVAGGGEPQTTFDSSGLNASAIS